LQHEFFAVCGELFCQEVAKKQDAVVIAVHSESVYIRLEGGRLILMAPHKYGRVPFGAAIDDYARFRSTREFTEGERVLIDSGALCFSDGTRIVLNTEYRAAEVFEYSKVSGNGTLLKTAQYLLEHASDRGMVPSLCTFLCFSSPDGRANAYAQKAAAEADAVEEALSLGDEEKLFFAVSRFIGLGYGLTPSGDDLICGMLYAFHRLSSVSARSRYCCRMLSSAAQRAIAGTNEVSAEYIRCAIAGEPFEIIDRVISGLGEYDEKGDGAWQGLRAAVDSLLSVGASSGSDILCGILFAIYILTALDDN